jgi:hypothetical protein
MNLSEAEGLLRVALYTEINGIPVMVLVTTGARMVIGDWVLDPDKLLVAHMCCAGWFVGWAALARKLYRAGKWAKALFSFAIGYEGAWMGVMTLYIVADRAAEFLVYALPFAAVTFFAISIMTAAVLWVSGMRNLIVGLPRMLMLAAEKRGLFEKCAATHLQKSTPPSLR